jgi:hypothetical protein
MHDSRSRALRILLPVLALLLITACGGGGSNAASSKTTVSSPATTGGATIGGATTSTAGKVNAGGGDLARTLCNVIRDVESRLGASAVSAAYVAQFAMGAASAVAAHGSGPIDSNTEAAVKSDCPDDYQRFLAHAKITSLGAV